MTASATSGTLEVPDVAVFTHARRKYRAADLLVGPRVEVALARIARGEAARQLGEGPDDVRREAEREFRYARGLVAADEMEAWLQQWELQPLDWRGHMRRETALTHPSPELALHDRAEVDATGVWSSLVCGGTLEELATERAQQLAAGAALGLADPKEADHAVVETFLVNAVDDASIDRELRNHALDWLELHWTRISAPNHDAALEARACLVEDQMAIADVARRLGSPAEAGAGWLHEAPPDLRDLLIEVDVGDVKVRVTDADDDQDEAPNIEVVAVHRRRRADETAAPTRAAVRERLARRALQGEVHERIRWHVTF